MTIFVDASAIVAMIDKEPEADDFADQLELHNDRLYSVVAACEAAKAIARLRKRTSLARAADIVAVFAHDMGLRMVSTDEPERRHAIDASVRYGKGSGNPAQLNMGDCFAYACAKTNEARLLYKGEDFSHTDLG